MFDWLLRRYRWRKIIRAAKATVREGKGHALHQWSWQPADRETIASQVRTWLEQEARRAGAPYGYSDYSVALRLAQRTEHGYQTLWDQHLPPFTRETIGQGLEQVVTRIQELDQSTPAETRLEVYFISLGDILMRSYEKLGA